MIDKKELRRGNLIQIVFKEPFEATYIVRVCEILDHAVHYEVEVISDIKLPRFGNSEYHGIPLTEERLLWLGFENDLGSKAYRRGQFCIVLWPTGIFTVEYKNIELLEIKYVHRLQNLYFELEDKELEPK